MTDDRCSSCDLKITAARRCQDWADEAETCGIVWDQTSAQRRACGIASKAWTALSSTPNQEGLMYGRSVAARPICTGLQTVLYPVFGSSMNSSRNVQHQYSFAHTTMKLVYRLRCIARSCSLPRLHHVVESRTCETPRTCLKSTARPASSRGTFRVSFHPGTRQG